ncbi:hypothetical protein HPB50_008631 [Hyalomma asiaticum]|uniref:Uncharacterized protein n=1 Tax=Hyalomma asiaticum TaxID=266040 RepID=A0ACB7RY07_HYAAI|nr:hypothetical protein HPB50_008631 [Hyalomma asiaticum]
MPTATSAPVPPCVPPKSPDRLTPKVTSSGQRDQTRSDGTQEDILRAQPAAVANPRESHHSAMQPPSTTPNFEAVAKTQLASVDKGAPTTETPPVAPVLEAVPSATTVAAAPGATFRPQNASTTSTHSGPGTSRASRHSATSTAVYKKRRASSASSKRSVLMLLAHGAWVVLVIGTLIVVLFILLTHSAQEPVEGNAPKVEQYCHTKDCEQHAQLILSKVNMNVDPCEDLNAFACSHWEPQGESYDNYGGALDSEAFHSWFANFRRSLGEGSAHLQAGARALTMFGSCLWHRTNANESEHGKRVLREFMTKLRIPWPDEPSADVDPLGPLPLQQRSEPPPRHDLPKPAGATSEGPAESRGNGGSHRPLLMSLGGFVGYWSVHNSEIVHKRNYIMYWDMFYKAFGANRPLKSEAYVQQVVAVERDVLEEFVGVVNNEKKEPARFQLSDFGNHTPNLPASRWIEQLDAFTPRIMASGDDSAGNHRGFAPSDTLTVTDTAILRAVNRLFGTHNSTMLLRHISWFFIQASGTVFGALADRDLLVAKYGDKMKASVRRHVFCATEVEDAYGPLVSALYVFPRFTARIRFAIDDTFANEAAEKTSSLAWADNATRWAATAKLRNARTVLWPPDTFLTNEVLTETYANFSANLTFAGSLFIDYWIDAQRNLQALYDDPSLRDVLSLPPNYVLPYFNYNYLQNRVVISVAALNGVLRAVQATPAVVYGGLGFSYARQLLRALDSGGLNIDAEGNIVPNTWASPQWKKAMRERQRKSPVYS